ncbi:flagellar assembly protein FliH [Natronospira proteinivora]|uniref:Flagellar assembly protein FliH n=1 Tax=Natronospira proteinivora TaxID=1807133 RepID=A0ABT1G7U8_9GAMM|nr:flagellar assembly protein FliH [Natronospira proteinivora]MCP1726438.1 flagellar assembly protein FliH [Natronospira proteinivora]
MSEGEQWRRWEAPTVGERRSPRPSPRKPTSGKGDSAKPASRSGDDKQPVTAAEIETIQEAAYREAYEKGYQEGYDSGEAEVRRRAEEVSAILNALTEPLDAVDREVEQELSDLVCVVARQLIRRELRTDPGQIVAVVREAVKALPSGDRQVRVQLNPEDAALIRELTGPSKDTRWELAEDPSLSRGGCIVSDRNSRVDVRLEHQVGRVLAAMLGEEREAPEELGELAQADTSPERREPGPEADDRPHDLEDDGGKAGSPSAVAGEDRDEPEQ